MPGNRSEEPSFGRNLEPSALGHSPRSLTSASSVWSPLPARTTCPLCGQRRLHVYEDTPCGGAWFCCPDWGRSGALVELAAVWGMGLPATLAQLARLGAPLPAEALDPQRDAGGLVEWALEV